MVFKITISFKEKSYQIERDAPQLIGMKINDVFSGNIIGLPGYKLKITGGSDNCGFPMRSDVEGSGKRKLLLGPGIGFKGKKGEKKRKTIRGNTISESIVQINCKIIEVGEKPLEELIGKDVKEESKEKETKK